MTFEPSKLLHNIELKLRGRTALLAIGLAVILGALWVVMKDYPEHPLFSQITGSILLLAIVGFIFLGLLGKSRPEETLPRSLTQVTKTGIFIFDGINSQKDFVQLLKQINGVSKLPLPSHKVRGSAAQKSSYVPLTEEQSTEIVESIEKHVEKLFAEAAGDLPEQQPQIQDECDKNNETSGFVVKGRTLSD